jgi:hypothetical protein
MQDSSRAAAGPSRWEVEPCPLLAVVSAMKPCSPGAACIKAFLQLGRGCVSLCCRDAGHAGQLWHAERVARSPVSALCLVVSACQGACMHACAILTLCPCVIRAGLGGLPTSASQQPAALARFGAGAFAGQGGLPQVRAAAAVALRSMLVESSTILHGLLCLRRALLLNTCCPLCSMGRRRAGACL